MPARHPGRRLQRRTFIKQCGAWLAAAGLNPVLKAQHKLNSMEHYEVIIIGGSYSGLAAAMALGRARKKTLVIDDGRPCNKQTPYSHNFLTQDGIPPATIAAAAKAQVEKYPTVSFFSGRVLSGAQTAAGFTVVTGCGTVWAAEKLIFATGIEDLLPGINGLSACWGISVLHCPYCHGYEVRDRPTGIIGSGDSGFEFARLISNWTDTLTLFSNGPSALSAGQLKQLAAQGIGVVEKKIAGLNHEAGYVNSISFTDGDHAGVRAVYVRAPFRQQCPVPGAMGCERNADGYLVTNAFQETSVRGIYACGDSFSPLRTVANAVSSGTAAGMAASKALILNKQPDH